MGEREADKAEAEERGRDLLKKMKGKGWRVVVWENCGWNYVVHAPHITVHPCHNGQYMALISKEKDGSGTPCHWHDPNTYKDPNAAVRRAVSKARRVVLGELETVTTVIKMLRGLPA